MGGHPDFAEFEEILKEFFQNGRGPPAEPERDLQDVWEGILGFTLISLTACGASPGWRGGRLWPVSSAGAGGGHGTAGGVSCSLTLVLARVLHWTLSIDQVRWTQCLSFEMLPCSRRWLEEMRACAVSASKKVVGDKVSQGTDPSPADTVLLVQHLSHLPRFTEPSFAETVAVPGGLSLFGRAIRGLFKGADLVGSCWTDGYSAELCCDTQTFGPGGNAGCWDGSETWRWSLLVKDEGFTYKACCCDESHGCWVAPQLSQAAPWGHWGEPPLGNPVEELSVGLFPTYEPGKDCWTGSAATYAKCCDLTMNPMGNIWNCWDNNRFTFERCCFLGEAALGEAPPKPLLRPALRAQATRAAPEELLFQRPAGQECWVHGFTFAACCLAGINSCWDEIFTHAACCDGRPQLPQAGPIVEATNPIVNCLDLSSHLTLDLEQRPRQCPQRYFYLATMGTALIGADRKGFPWWYPADDVQMVKPLRPQRMHFVGGICVPSSCSVEATASYLAPLVAPWWRSPRAKAQPLNASHVTLPPPLAVRHKAFGDPKAKINLTFTAWTALRPANGEALADLDRCWVQRMASFTPWSV
ncbi:unnamed protein product [Cladocopium goreaui]|uniref:CCHC-type domain-containing protein n=1 Tax=Cladocopium goreaui TaxID=2562237 RepID=A0A9P1CH35_9DINO|nr:unnamed protein product [Cladocopium goreaui]